VKGIKTDIISEILEQQQIEASKYSVPFKYKNDRNDIKIDHFTISNKYQSKKLNRPIGEYYLIDTKSTYFDDTINNVIVDNISEILTKLLPNIDNNFEIIVVGLGNEKIQSDSLGKKVCENIIITKILSNSNFKPKISAIAPSVMGETGIESFDIISGIIKRVKPHLLIIIDSLCAGHMDRLGKSIQITNVGIIPGAGINNPKKKFTKSTLGCDVITIGVPLMIYAKTLCNDKCIDDELILTFHDIDLIVDRLSSIIAKGINLALLGIETID